MAKRMNTYQKTVQSLMSKLSSIGAEHDAEIHRRELIADDGA
jgi:hypothetical protein